jgi:short subunit dehydrogenase-like uncharacterized protein
MNQTQADLDLIVWGATGFTGRLVVEYLLARYGVDKTVRWAIAGRSQAKLDELPVEGGLWTPASAMGDALLKRLPESAGLTFTVEE